ncbi:MAG TPA: branched-chain amino acid transaminase [Stellaceae bacterium]|jgi:branched-chain amino acid aminotransferase|nr:branched-chain amino acid transaminase [Stellaceae bacterium]
MQNPKYLSMNGEIVPFADAKIHTLTPGVKYGTGVFEGIRGYWNERRKDMYLFRLEEHLNRLHFSMKVMRFEHQLENRQMTRALIDLIKANELREDVHIRLLVWLDGEGDMNATGPIGWSIAALPRPPSKAVSEGVHCAVSSWRRISDNAMPARVKATANYNNGRLATLQGRIDGYDNVIILTHQGRVSESPGSCFFMVRNGVPTTPGVNSDILESVTRATVMQIFSEYLGRETVERDIDRTELYAAEETFFCGSGYEIQPILSIDRQPVGTGTAGELTRALQQKYFALVRGETGDHPEWRTPVYLKNE